MNTPVIKSLLKKGDTVALVACSDLLNCKYSSVIQTVVDKISQIGLHPIVSDCLFHQNNLYVNRANQKAEILNSYFANSDIKAIFDVSGGDLANEIIPYIDLDIVKNNPKLFSGYSDLTCIINSIYAKTANLCMLYQLRNIADQSYGEIQLKRFADFVYGENRDLLDFNYRLINGGSFGGIVVGGNIRCLLKLAGTEMFPNVNGKILLIESLSGGVNRIIAYFAQLKMMGVFDRIVGLVLGTFTELELSGVKPEKIILNFVPENLPIVKTQYIGHGSDSFAVMIGSYYEFK